MPRLITINIDGVVGTPDLSRMSLKKLKAVKKFDCLILCDPPGARTQDPNIKSVVLYLLS